MTWLVWPWPYVASAVATFCAWFVVFSLLFVMYRKRRFQYFTKQGIPGPKPKSIIFGNVTETVPKGATTVCHEWAQKYGKTFGYFEGSRPILVSSDLEILRQILVKQSHNFHGRKLYPMQPDPGTGEVPFSSDKDSILVLTDGDLWKRIRTIINPTFSTLKMKQITPLMNGCIDVLLEIMEEKCRAGDAFDIYECFGTLTLDVIATCAFGLDIDCQRKGSEFKTRSNEVLSSLSSYDVFDVLTIAFPELFKVWRAWSFLRKPHPYRWMKDRAGEIIKLRMEDKNSVHRTDLLQIMLNTSVFGPTTRDRKSSAMDGYVCADDTDRKRKDSSSTETTRRKISVTESFKNAFRRNSTSGADEDKKKTGVDMHEPLTFEELRTNTALFIIVGSDTSSTLLAYLSYDLAMNQDVQDRLYSEIADELRDKEVIGYEDVHKLTQLDLAVKETLRMHAIVSNEIFCRRCCVDKTIVNGIEFELNMIFKPDIMAVHFDEEQWGPVDVHKYYPDRHLPEYSEKRHPLAFIPFGAGPRHCVGMRFALLQVKLVMTRTLLKYRLMKTEETELKTKENITLIPKDGLFVGLEAR